MAFVISILNQKGGVGKTTTSINLSRAFQLMGFSVTFIDTDSQGSARMWKAQSESDEFNNEDQKYFPLLAIDQPTIHNSLGSISSDIIVIDGSPTIGQISASAIKGSDLVIIPVQPSPLDIWATNTLVDMVNERILITDGKLKACFLATAVKPMTTIGKEITAILENFNLPILESKIHDSVNYSNAFLKGQTIFEYTRPNSDTYQRSFNLAKEIVSTYFPSDLAKKANI